MKMDSKKHKVHPSEMQSQNAFRLAKSSTSLEDAAVTSVSHQGTGTEVPETL
jgi:hypothetical protein